MKLLEITMLASPTGGCDVKCYNNKELQRFNAQFEMVCGMARIRKATNEPWLQSCKQRYHNANTILRQVERHAVEIAFSKFWFVGEMVRRRQRPLSRVGVAVAATFLIWSAMQHFRMHKSKWRISW